MTTPDPRDSVERPFMQRCYTCGRESPYGPLLHYPGCQVGSSALPQQAGGEDVAALQAEVARRTDSVIVVGGMALACSAAVKERFDALLKRAEAAEAALREAQANDRRYRWLRSGSGDDCASPYVCGVHGAPMGDAGWLTGDDLDAAIDAAIGGTGDA